MIRYLINLNATDNNTDILKVNYDNEIEIHQMKVICMNNNEKNEDMIGQDSYNCSNCVSEWLLGLKEIIIPDPETQKMINTQLEKIRENPLSLCREKNVIQYARFSIVRKVPNKITCDHCITPADECEEYQQSPG